MEALHRSVMLEEVLRYLTPRGESETMVDATLGEGGHSVEFLRRFPGLSVVGIDADPEIQGRARERLEPFGGRISFRLGYYDDVLAMIADEGEKADTVFFDLGVSTFHFEASGRGFSFRKDEPLDMRLSPDAPMTARDIVNGEKEEEIARILFEYGEERYSRRIARAIAEARRRGRIENSRALAEIVASSVPPEYRRGILHPATRTFQALRIAVNDELGRISRALESAASILRPGGIIGVISFHSLEDRIAKNFFREKNKSCTCPPAQPICTCGGQRGFEILTKKPLPPSPLEAEENPPSRSAKFRAARKLR
jgi:16S rRNA (cytosine1402-N4)-methyltransferase